MPEFVIRTRKESLFRENEKRVETLLRISLISIIFWFQKVLITFKTTVEVPSTSKTSFEESRKKDRQVFFQITFSLN